MGLIRYSSFFKYTWDIMILLQRSYFMKEIIVVHLSHSVYQSVIELVLSLLPSVSC